MNPIIELEKNKNKTGDNIKQYSYGQDCISAYNRAKLSTVINFLWDKVDKKSQFFKDNLIKYKLFDANQKPMKKKEPLCFFLQDMMAFLDNNKVDGKRWFKKLK